MRLSHCMNAFEPSSVLSSSEALRTLEPFSVSLWFAQVRVDLRDKEREREREREKKQKKRERAREREISREGERERHRDRERERDRYREREGVMLCLGLNPAPSF